MKTQLLTLFPKRMIAAINAYSQEHFDIIEAEHKKKQVLLQVGKDLDIWLKFFPKDFQKAFLNQIPLAFSKAFHVSKTRGEKPTKTQSQIAIKVAKQYIEFLQRQNGLKIFIGRDAYLLFHLYTKLKNDAVYIPYSRPFLFKQSNSDYYIWLIELIYKAAKKSRSFSQFKKTFTLLLRKQRAMFTQLLEQSFSLLTKHNVIPQLHSTRFLVVDAGIHGSLALLLDSLLSSQGYKGSLSLFYVYSWLQHIYKDRIFYNDPYVFSWIEYESLKLYQKKKG